MARRLRIQTILALAVVAAIGVGLVVDGVRSVASAEGDGQRDRVTAATIAGSSSGAPLWIARERGYFAEEGIDIRLQEFKAGAEMIPAVATDQVQAGLGGLSAGLFNAIDQGQPLKIVADGAKSVDPGYVGLVVRKGLAENGRFRLSQLRGRTIAIPGPGTSPQVQLGAFLRAAGLTEDDVRIEQVGFADQIAALDNGAVDAGITLEPSMTTAVENGAVRVAGSQTVLPDQHQVAMFYGPALTREDPELGRRFMRAYVRGVRDYLAGLRDGRVADTPEGRRLAETLARNTPVDDPQRYVGMALQSIDEDGRIPAPLLQRDIDYWRSQGLIDGRPDASDALDWSFVDQAMR